jgi:predicted HTH transcriptional regulator
MFDSLEELAVQIRLGEDSALEMKNLEFRGDHVIGPSRPSMADELAAMANTSSGVFVLGVDDKTHAIVGLPEDKLDGVETWLRGICIDQIDPPLNCRIRKQIVLAEDGTERIIVRIDVQRSLYVHKSPGGYFQRIGSSKRQLSPESLARLFQQRSQTRIVRFDEQSVPYAPVACLEKKYWDKYRTSYSPVDDQDFLMKMKLLTLDESGEPSPSVSGVLIASERPDRYLPNAYIQAVCYRGNERNADYQIDAKDLVGPIDDQVSQGIDFVFKNMKLLASKNPSRIDIPQYSLHAVFEALVNAVAHRDYSIQSSKIRLHLFADHLELYSPGAIPNTMTIDSLPLRQASRNELLTSLLARCPVTNPNVQGVRGFLMDKRGEGVPIILSESERLSGIKPVYRLIDDAELLLTIPARLLP